MAMYIPYDRGGRAAQAQATMAAIQQAQAARQQRQARRRDQLLAEVDETATGSLQVWIANQHQRDPQALRRTLRRAGYDRRDVDGVIERALDQVNVRDDLDPTTVQRQAAEMMLRGSRVDGQLASGQEASLEGYQPVSRLEALAERAGIGQRSAFTTPQVTMPQPQAEQPGQRQPLQPAMPRSPAVGQPQEMQDMSYQERLRFAQEAMRSDRQAAVAEAGQAELEQRMEFADVAAPPAENNPFAQFQGRVFEQSPDGQWLNIGNLIQSPEFVAYLGHPYVNRATVRRAAEQGQLSQELIDQFARSQAALTAVDTGQPQQLSPQAVVGFLSGAGIQAEVSSDGRGVVVQEGYSGGVEQLQRNEAVASAGTVQPATTPLTASQDSLLATEATTRFRSFMQRAVETGNDMFAGRAGRELRVEAEREERTSDGRRRQAEGLLMMLANPRPREIAIYGALVDDEPLMQLGSQLMLQEVAMMEAATGGMSEVEIEYMRAQTANQMAHAAERWQNVNLAEAELNVELLSTISNLQRGIATARGEGLATIVRAENMPNEYRRRATAELFNLEGWMKATNEEAQGQLFSLLGLEAYPSGDVAQFVNPEWWRTFRREGEIEFAGDVQDAEVQALSDALLSQ